MLTRIWYNKFCQADVAQLVEYRLPKPSVAGSSPVIRSRRKNTAPNTEPFYFALANALLAASLNLFHVPVAPLILSTLLGSWALTNLDSYSGIASIAC